MSRKSPVPDIRISTTVIEDENTGERVANTVIDFRVGEYSNGFAVLDEPGDLYILRNAVDDYIKKNHIKNPFL